jgi:hypothetical protein
MPDNTWEQILGIDHLTPSEAEVALAAITQHFEGGMTVNEAVQFRRMQKALQAKIEGH